MLKDLCFEIIQTCPNKCIFCSSCSDIEKDKIISFDQFKLTIDYLMNHGGVEEISLSGGEPFLHPDLLKMIIYCKSYGIRTVLFTSGIKKRTIGTPEEMALVEADFRKYYSQIRDITPEDIEKFTKRNMDIINQYNSKTFSEITSNDYRVLEQAGLDKIVFDLQAWEKEPYNEMMGSQNTEEYVITSLANSSSTTIEKDAHFIPTKVNYRELNGLVEILNYCKFDQLSILNFVPQGRGEINQDRLIMSDSEFTEFIRLLNIQKTIFKGKVRVGIPLMGEAKHLCTAGFSKMVIKYDGTVLPCPAFKEYDLATLNKMGIKTPNIYTDLDKVEIHEGHRKYPLCKKLYDFNRSI